jgi:hypothetical protein
LASSFSIEIGVDASRAKYSKGTVRALLSLKNGDKKSALINSTSITVQLDHPVIQAEITWDNDIISQLLSYRQTASQGHYLTAVGVSWGQHAAEKSDEPDGNYAESVLPTHLLSESGVRKANAVPSAGLRKRTGPDYGCPAARHGGRALIGTGTWPPVGRRGDCGRAARMANLFGDTKRRSQIGRGTYRKGS